MRDLHVDDDLSAYLDGELAPADQARVEAHVASCDRCSRRLADLRATASLIAGLPYSRPARSLVPRVTQRWGWLRPLRSLSALASGAFLFLFLLTAVAQNSAGLGGGGTSAIPAAAPAAPLASAGAASVAVGVPGLPPTAVPVPAFGAPADTSQRSSAGTAAPSIATDQRKAAEAATAAPAPNAGAPAASNAAPAADAGRSFGAFRNAQEPRRSPLQEPLLWLALAIIAAIFAIGMHVRLRAT